MVDTAFDDERAVRADAPHVLCLDKGARPPGSQVRDVQPAACACRERVERVVDVACRDAHPARAAEHVASLRIGLRGEFGHAVFRMNLPDPEGVAEDSVELLFGNLLAVTLHAARLHHHRIAELRSVPLREVPQRIAYAQQDFRLRVALHRRQQSFAVIQIESA